MSKKIFDVHWIICFSIWLVAAFGCLLSFIVGNETGENLLYAFIVLFVLFIALLFRPVSIEFDKKSLTIHFLFGFFQKLNWDTVWKVERQSMRQTPGIIKYMVILMAKKHFLHHLKFHIVEKCNDC